MRVEIKRLQRELGVTTLYVTHDQVEAMTMADMVAVMHDGELQQLAPPTDLYAHPANLFVARFCGSPPMNVLRRRRRRRRLPAPRPARSRWRARPGARPGASSASGPSTRRMVAPGDPTRCAGEVYVVEPLGNETLVAVSVGDELINVRAAADVDPAVGARCGVCPGRTHIHLFDPDSGSHRAPATRAAVPSRATDDPAPIPTGVPGR